MKIVIIGAGIAGLTQGIYLKREGHSVIIAERFNKLHSKGHAFLMSGEGFKRIKSFSKHSKNGLKYQKIDIFSLKRPSEEEFIRVALKDWYCMKRVDLIDYLISFFDEKEILFNHQFSHFEYFQEKATAAVFKNGQRIEGELFIGADGSNSEVRNSLFGRTKFSTIAVKEIVGVSKYTSSTKLKVFQKFQSDTIGLSFGYIPVSDSEYVWFIQYDSKLEKNQSLDSSKDLKEFCFALMNEFPIETKEILKGNNFNNSYVWNTRDFDMLDRFHNRNIGLIGDAAHLTLPFTSAGTSNAINDAFYLSKALKEKGNLEEAFNSFYKNRSSQVLRHLRQGRELKKVFLNPKKFNERGFVIPLVAVDPETKEKNKPIRIIYFTDPICSSCWVLQPILRKLSLEYSDSISIEYHMGGLLPNWENYSDSRISKPEDAAKLWDEIREKERIPISGDIWINDPLLSSYPSCIAFKSAQLQNKDKAVFFLRRLKEMLFMEKKNINSWQHIEEASLSCGLDAALLKKQMENEGVTYFKKDLELASKLNVKVFPTLYFELYGEQRVVLIGLKSFEIIEKKIKKLLPNIKKNKYKPNPIDLFKLYNNMTSMEFAFLLNMPESIAVIELEKLERKKTIKRHSVEEIEFWQYTQD